MQIYIDINDFNNASILKDAINSYDKIRTKLDIFIKANALEHASLEDLKCVRRRNSFEPDSLKNISYYLSGFNSFESLKLKDNSTYFRVYNDTINNTKKVFMFYNHTLNKEDLLLKIEQIKAYYKTHIQDTGLKIGIIEKFDTSTELYKEVKLLDEYNGIVSLNSIFENKNNIILIDDEAAFYIFTLLNYHSKFRKVEKDIKSYFSSFKPFGYQKMVEKEVNLDNLFEHLTFEIEKDGKITAYIKQDSSPSEIVESLTFLEQLKDFTKEEY